MYGVNYIKDKHYPMVIDPWYCGQYTPGDVASTPGDGASTPSDVYTQ